MINSGVQTALEALDVETVDHVVCKIPDELLTSDVGSLHDTLARAADTLEKLCIDERAQSYGFALTATGASVASLEPLIEKALVPLAAQFERFASLQLPIQLGANLLPLPTAVSDFRDEYEMLLIGDRPLETVLSNGKPLLLKSYEANEGDDVAALLKSAFNLAISVEKTFMDKVAPSLSHLEGLPEAKDVAWAHILANQHGQFDNLEEWHFVLETQIYPHFETTLKQLALHEETKQIGFAYSVALRELFKCFTASVEVRRPTACSVHSICLLTVCLYDAVGGLEPYHRYPQRLVITEAGASGQCDHRRRRRSRHAQRRRRRRPGAGAAPIRERCLRLRQAVLAEGAAVAGIDGASVLGHRDILMRIRKSTRRCVPCWVIIRVEWIQSCKFAIDTSRLRLFSVIQTPTLVNHCI